MSAEIIDLRAASHTARENAMSGSDPIFELIEQHRVAFDASEASPDEDDDCERALYELNCRLAETYPVTLAGVIAIMRYRRELQQVGYDLFAMHGDGTPPDDITVWLAVIERTLDGIVRRAAG